MDMDNIDRKILTILQQNARTPLMKSAGVLNDQINQAAGVGPYAAAQAAPADAYAGQTREA